MAAHNALVLILIITRFPIQKSNFADSGNLKPIHGPLSAPSLYCRLHGRSTGGHPRHAGFALSVARGGRRALLPTDERWPRGAGPWAARGRAAIFCATGQVLTSPLRRKDAMGLRDMGMASGSSLVH